MLYPLLTSPCLRNACLSTGIAERTLDIYTAAVLAEKFVDHVDPKPVWRKRMDTLSEVSCNAYRTVITGKCFLSFQFFLPIH